MKEGDLGVGGRERSVIGLMISLTRSKGNTLVALQLLLKGLVTVCTRFPSGSL